ncbi:SCO-spondin-like [Dromaius novaehollandiae]|uniref:SCO-spondin-like n=1 Tax=Dromaius novaehollandiae TaxID=8790 RepID=UPI00311FAB85
MPGAARPRGPGGARSGILASLLLCVAAEAATGRWCERTERVTEEVVVTPRREEAVPCTSVYQYSLAGWRIDRERTRRAHRTAVPDAGTPVCYLYKPPETRPVPRNRTVRVCCPGWSGPRCTQGAGSLGRCFSGWQCQDAAGAGEPSPMSLAECCGRPWGHSWSNASSAALCFACSHLPLDGASGRPSPVPALALPPRRPFASCLAWAGSRYRSFDGTHFRFAGTCAYSLAAAADGTWAVTIAGGTPRALHMTFGLDAVAVRGRNVSVNGAAVPEGEPRLRHGIGVRWLGDFLAVESGLGVRVKSDGRDTVHVTVGAELRGGTRGLCGPYNDDPADDFQQPGGEVAALAASFGNSWRIPDSELACRDAVEDGPGCAEAEGRARQPAAEEVCGKLLAPPFSRCHGEVDPGGFYAACLDTFCREAGAGPSPPAAVCDTFASYVRDCAQRQTYIDWRRPGFCERRCGPGQRYSDCVSSCPASCAAVGTAEEGHCRDDCAGGCECSPGLYLDGGACVPASACPCRHRRRQYAPGESIRQSCNRCTCRGGRWLCTRDRCSAECAVLGHLHYVTFDRKRFSLPGACEYTLVQDFVDGKLLITAEHEPCGSRGPPSCLRALSVTVHGTSARLRGAGDVTVNGKAVTLPFASADVTIRRASSSFVLLQAFGAHVLWGLETPTAYVTLQPRYANKVRGLCGTYNWDQQDEFATPAGDVEASVSAFANKYRASGDCPALSPFPFDPCGAYAQRRDSAEAACAVLHGSAFQPCHDLVEREPFYQLCLHDACACPAGRSCLCPALAAYARQCAQEGAELSWRNRTFCGVQCGGGQAYLECSRPCGRTCAELRLPGAGSCPGLEGVCVPGCNCPRGLVLDDGGQCVPPGACPCRHADGTYAPGSTVRKSCNTCVCTAGAWNCTASPCPAVARCPGELVYAVGSCLRTCDSAEPNGTCAGLSDGCVCPPGTVFLDGRCVSPEECPCHHNGRLYQPNDTIVRDCNTCVCRRQRWHCSSRQCAGTCVATGDPHYVTFDGRAFSFLGDCEYVLAREADGLFTVTAENVPCGAGGVTCTKSVVVTLGNTVVHMLRGRDVTVNGVSVRPPKVYSGNGLTLERAGLFLVLLSRLGLTVLWDGGTRVYVKLDPQHRGRVAGLCGNFDRDAENDFASRQGVVEPTADLFSNSWRVSLLCPEVDGEDAEHPCTENPHRVPWARKRCSVLTQRLFAPCHDAVPCQQFYEWCVFDACGCDSGGDCECLCTAIAAYAEECGQRGIHVRWRSQELCPLQCDRGLEYLACGPACPQTCKNVGLELPERCETASCLEGCFCPEGKVLHEDGCIDPSECPCYWEGTSFPSGAVLQQGCKNCTCEAGLWQCGSPAEPCAAEPRCAEEEFACRASGRCVPSAWVCDNEDDCGDGSDEFCALRCAPHQYRCASGQCVPWGARCDGAADCLDASDEGGCPAPACAPGEFRCAGGRCIPRAHVCDGELDCGFADDSDEAGCSPSCGAGEYRCAAGRCVPYLQRCDGRDDCGDLSDERGCVCPGGHFQCPEATCLPPAAVCDGKDDCATGTDEAFCPGRVTCAPGQLLCPDGSCIGSAKVCDGTWDCGDGSDESPERCAAARATAVPASLLTVPANRTAAPPCGRYEFPCGSGGCKPRGWVCDGEADCADGSDELGCNRTCGLERFPCALGAECIPYAQLCDGVPHCRDRSDESADNCGSTQIPPCPGHFVCNSRLCVNVSRVCDGALDCPQGEDELACEGHVPAGERNRTAGPCAEYACGEGTCIAFKQVCDGLADCADGSAAAGWLPSDERGCGLWSPWAPWSACSRSCGPGLQVRARGCTRRAPGVLHQCRGEGTQARQCFSMACPVDGAWSEWATWSNCTADCRGVVVRRRGCVPPRNGGLRCADLPGGPPATLELDTCRLDDCRNVTACPAGLLRRTCAPCPTSCADLSSRAQCRRDRPCSPGCWCAEGLVLDGAGRCVRPGECPCEVDGTRYRPGQLAKVNCRVCVCQDGQMKRCRHNPECTVNCGWSSWSPWGDCLGPCGVQSIQWSFRSPNNPSKHGGGRQCRGIYRKARRCQTEPCQACEQGGRPRAPGTRWRWGQCQVCQCLPDLTVQCSPYCPYGAAACPEGQVLVEGRGDACCYCANAEPCYGPLGIAALPDSSFTASSEQAGNPARAGRLHRVAPGLELQGWAPPPDAYPQLLSQPPFLQLDLLEPRNLTGVVVQGAGSSDAYVTAFLLRFSADGVRWHDYRELFQGNSDDSTPVARTFGRMLQARLVRILPQDFHNGIFLRAELLGCGRVSPAVPGAATALPDRRLCRAGEFQCRNGRCVPGGPRGALCDGADDCGDLSDELRCGTGSPAAPRQCLPPRFPCAPAGGCLEPSQRCDGVADCPDSTDEAGCALPGSAAPTAASASIAAPARAGVLGPSTEQPSPPHGIAPTPQGTALPGTGMPVPAVTSGPAAGTPSPTDGSSGAEAVGELVTLMKPMATTPPAPLLPRLLCARGQFACAALGCVEAAAVCDGRQDCLDGSDETQCGGPTASAGPMVPTAWPPTCSPKQFSCGSGECLALDKRCDLHRDCADGSDESDCVDCIMSAWSGWSECSRSCGLGVTFRRRDLLRNALPGGACDRREFDSRSCFLRACPVHGAWAAWGAWSQCDAECRGGVRSRARSCADPPPKNGGQPCPGEAVQTQPCNLQPCGDARDCGPEMVFVQAGDCERGLASPCARACGDLSAAPSCRSPCEEGCRCPPGLFLQEGGCVNASQCHCYAGQQRRLPGEVFPRGGCSQCVCLDGVVTCEDAACPVDCGWSAWSAWTACDRSCGAGMQQRFRSPSNPAAAHGGAPCDGDAQEVRQCHVPCATAEPSSHWSAWTSWSPCSKTCFHDADRVGTRKRFRHCGGGAGACPGPAVQEETCDTPPCPVGGVWTPWTAWSECSAPCDAGVQTRNRSCSRPAHGGPGCAGPLVQTRDCNTQPCKALCPGDMVYRTAEECRRGGGACPRLCLDQGAGVECAAHCYEGCYCPDGLFLQNDTCVPRGRCLCYHRGALYRPGDTVALDACNNCTCTAGEMVCGTEPCPVHCGWSSWTAWSACSRSCNVGTRRRYRTGSAPPAAFGGRDCRGPGVEMEFCSPQPCRAGAEWGPWSECSVPCGGGYRNRTRSSPLPGGLEFSTCSLAPCPAEAPGVCPAGKVWKECADVPGSCAELSTVPAANATCRAGCFCPPGAVLLNNECVAETECPCAADGKLYPPGAAMPWGCENCSCVAGRITNCSRAACDDASGRWSTWTPWSECSASCGLGLQRRHRLCAAAGTPCPGPQPEPEPEPDERPCILEPCAPPDCAAVEGSTYSRCGPSCPRSCDDIAHCAWRCEPGCYCPPGRVLDPGGAACVAPRHCPCLDLLTGRRYLPGETVARGDGCNNCTCTEGKLLCTGLPCPVPGGWCDWSPWTPCSRSCGGEAASRYRACSCPQPQRGGAACAGEQERHGDAGLQRQRKGCPAAAAACPVDGAWGAWGPWSPCEGCAGRATRVRHCASPAARFGGLPCAGEARQSRPCPEESSACEACGGGRVSLACGKPCPRACEDLHEDTACLEGPRCQPACACPPGLLLQDGACVSPDRCRCKYPNSSLGDTVPGDTVPGNILQPGESVRGPCQNCTCEAGQLRCRASPGCRVDGGWSPWGPWTPCAGGCRAGTQLRARQCSNPVPQGGGRGCRGQSQQQRACPTDGTCAEEEPWDEWSPWGPCSVSCGGGEQMRSRTCRQRECPGLPEQSRTCNTHVCREAGCPGGRLYRECLPGEGCPYSCAQLAGRVACFAQRCDEGCHCPRGAFLHRGACLQACPCAVPAEVLRELHNGSEPPSPPEVPHGSTLSTACTNCADPPPRADAAEGSGPWGPWSRWGPCSRSCTEPPRPATKSRSRPCTAAACTGEARQQLPCNLPHCAAVPCRGEECAGANCSWTPWGPWGGCSRSCGGGLQQRLRAYTPPGPGGRWCPAELGAHVQRRRCSPQPCRVDGAWSRWGPWSRCDRPCGGGRAIRTRACTGPPPKNGGQRCRGERHRVRVCNARPCGEGCPPGMAPAACASRCPRRCRDLQEGTACQDGEPCEPGCRCPDGTLEQDGSCVSPAQCECTDAQGRSWAPGSLFHDGCNNCTCAEGRLLCTNRSCPSQHCDWSSWSSWSPCSVTCGDGLQERFRAPTSGAGALECGTEQQESRACGAGHCPPLCPHGAGDRRLGDVWLQGDCQRCTCTPEGPSCQDVPCAGASSTAPGQERCNWTEWSPCSRSCGTGLASREATCACPAPGPPDAPCNASARQELRACYLRPCPDQCAWSPWTPWSPCSCSLPVQQRYRHQLGTGADTGAGSELCVGLDGQFRVCNRSGCSAASCQPPFEYRPCGSPCAGLCSTRQHPELCADLPPCLPGCFCPQGLLEQSGACVPPAQCGCLHVSGLDGPVRLAAGDTILLGCKECVCRDGALRCSSEGCQGLLPLSAWSEWSPCSPCLPLAALGPGTGSPAAGELLASVQRRYRTCLDPQSGRPWAGGGAACAAELQQERLCPRPRACPDPCLWGPWGPWGPCRAPCSGGFRLRRRHPQHPAGDGQCRGAHSQTESCNTAACPGEGCEHRGKVFAASCANGCPRTCADLWPHVECLQGGCKPGCRCPEGQLLQDGACVPVADCRCGLPRANGTLELRPGQAAEVECHNCTCANGSLACPAAACPSYGPWSAWSPCSQSCGGGSTRRHRGCEERAGGAPCAPEATEETAACNPQPCPAGCRMSAWSPWSPCSASCGGGISERSRVPLPAQEGAEEPCPELPLLLQRLCNPHNCTPECPSGQVRSGCANACPHACAHLRPGTRCLQEGCVPGCACPPGQVLQDGACVPPEECRCVLAPPVPWAHNLSREERAQEHPPGSRIHHRCNSCLCIRGAFNCSQQDCNADCVWSPWSPWSPCSATCGPGERLSRRHPLRQRLYEGAECVGPAARRAPCDLPDCACPPGEHWQGPGAPAGCERSCREVFGEPPRNCSGAAGCACEPGRYRSGGGECVTAARCECLHRGRLHQPGSEWLEDCATCRCVNGRAACAAACPPLACPEGEAKVQEPGSCCPVCRREALEEPSSMCQRFTEVRNITKGRCSLHGVEVSYCSGRCLSRTTVMPEEPYLQTRCDCCSYRLDPASPVRILSLRCDDGELEPVVLPVIHSCECSSCQGGDFSER